MNTALFRDRLVERLIEDLMGPLEENEILGDRPTQRYSTGILYPRGSRITAQEDEDGGVQAGEADEATSTQDDPGVSLHATVKPSVAGLSFAVKAAGQSGLVTIEIRVRCALYQRFAVDDQAAEIVGPPADRKHERWRRLRLEASTLLSLEQGETRVDLAQHGIPGLQLYMLVTPHAGLMTVTVAVSNERTRGDSSAYDEEQHFFQIGLEIVSVAHGEFSPRPSLRAEVDDDTRAAALIYKDVKEYVVGHTCSAVALLADGNVVTLKTEWIPAITVPPISDRGDRVFDRLRDSDTQRPLDAKWLAEASRTPLNEGLNSLVACYSEWIDREETRISGLPMSLQPQARKHIDRCRHAASRMADGIGAIRDDERVRTAFQLSQDAMAMQFAWIRPGAALVWRPFQIGFQLLVLSSLAERDRSDREVMDLLWFPTGGGKTEAYLALTAFTIFLRRLKPTSRDDGSGVAVLMRYTLRLLTIQQFQRAAALILACELIRRRAQSNAQNGLPIGTAPIGIGLWVGAAATPLTLREALNKPAGDPSTPEQLTTCPCCGQKLSWRLTPAESIVECSSEPEGCELRATGARLPVWTIDEEIYAKTPSLLIGTIDKFAQIVRKLETRALFGRGTSHAAPDLIVQDELHLISGPLGSIAGLYEVAIDELCRTDGARPKIIGSTATIRRAQEQIGALFDRETFQFPPPGISATNSGFAVTDDKHVGRTYVGVTTAGRSATYTLQALVASLLQSAADSAASKEERNYYWTLVTYFNSLRELGRALVLMQDDVPVSVGQFAARRSEKQRMTDAPAELTSRVPAYEIRDMLARLNVPADQPHAVDLLVASNMISVGMDIPRLGLMVVNSQPKTLAEYIQATSRVGRGGVPGVVVTMYNNTRARDRSRFETFQTWHRALYRDVEATSVTPFASRAQDKALHAVLVALVRHTVPGMERKPLLDDLRRENADKIAATIESRVARIDPDERRIVAQKLKNLLDEWASRSDLEVYWDDYGHRTSLLMSAEQFAAKADVDPDLDWEGARRALWPTPNSMREVEAGSPYVLRHVLRTEEKHRAE
jgi:Helicase conserved C-terminal domain